MGKFAIGNIRKRTMTPCVGLKGKTDGLQLQNLRPGQISIGSDQIGQGALAATEFLRNHPDVVQEIISRITAEPPLPVGVEADSKGDK